MNADIEWIARPQRPPQLMLFFHGVGGGPRDLVPLAQVFRGRFPEANLLLPEGFEPFDGGPGGGQWFSARGVTEANRVERVQAALPRFLAYIRAQQQRFDATPEATALVGFSQGAILSLAAAAHADGIAGRVLAFSGRYASLPEAPARRTTVHLFHGELDPVMPVAQARAAIERLNALGSDATVDIASGVGHELHAVLVERALARLATHVPQRLWAQAVGAAGDEQEGCAPA